MHVDESYGVVGEEYLIFGFCGTFGEHGKEGSGGIGRCLWRFRRRRGWFLKSSKISTCRNCHRDEFFTAFLFVKIECEEA